MCLAAVAIAQHARFPWVLASNRDEFFDRAAAPLAWWQPAPGAPRLLSGRDLGAGGTWLGLDETGRLALVTNVREPGRVVAGAPSRGELVLQWLSQGAARGDEQLAAMVQVPRNGYNFFAADLRGRGPAPAAVWLSNRPQPQQRRLGPGLYGLSNAALDTPWPKVTLLKRRLGAALGSHATLPSVIDAAFAALARPEPAPDAALPSTGVPLDRERQLSAAFIRMTDASGATAYGTRCSTVVVNEHAAGGSRVHVVERRFDAAGQMAGETAVAWALSMR